MTTPPMAPSIPPAPQVAAPAVPHFNFRLYTPKPFYSPPSLHPDPEVSSAAALYEQELRSYKHHEDLDRINFTNSFLRWEDLLERNVFVWASFTLLGGHYAAKSFYGRHLTRRRLLATTAKMGLLNGALMFLVTVLGERFQIQNWQKYKQPAYEVRIYQELDEKMDFFRDVGRIKQAQFASRADFNRAVASHDRRIFE